MKAVYRGKELVEVDAEEWGEESVTSRIGIFVLCTSLGKNPHLFYANKKDITPVFNHYLNELER